MTCLGAVLLFQANARQAEASCFTMGSRFLFCTNASSSPIAVQQEGTFSVHYVSKGKDGDFDMKMLI